MEVKHGIAAAIVGILITFVIVWANSGYGDVSDSAYQLAKATYSASAAKSPERMEAARTLLDDPEFSSNMSPREIGWFRKILDDANQNQWERAANLSREILESQVEQ